MINSGSGEGREVEVETLADGGYVVSWSSDQSGVFQVYARTFDAQGQPQGGEFIVSDHTDHSTRNASLLALDDGGVFNKLYG